MHLKAEKMKHKLSMVTISTDDLHARLCDCPKIYPVSSFVQTLYPVNSVKLTIHCGCE